MNKKDGWYKPVANERYGKLTVKRNSVCKKYYIECVCDCGKIIDVPKYNLINSISKSCGCLKSEKTHTRVSIQGVRHAMLVAIEPVGIKTVGAALNRQVLWLCKCDCGNFTKLTTSAFRVTKSCGCWKYMGVTKDTGVSAFNAVYSCYQRSARKSNRVFELSKEQFMKKTQQNCHYCGQMPTNEFQKNKARNGGFFGNGIDRVDNSIGYTIQNIVPCCVICNRAKHILGIKEFTEWVSKVYFHFAKKANLE